MKFVCQDQPLQVEDSDAQFNSAKLGSSLTVPIAHGEGNFEADQETLRSLEDEGRIVFRYVDRHGETTEDANPNGSWHNIAGITNEAGNVLGMMPHPERAMEELLGSTDGVALFTSMVASLQTS